MREVVIRNWDDLQREIFEGVWDPAIMRYRTNCVYRGMAVETWGLSHSLHRACAHDLTLERQMLRSFRKYGYADLNGVHSFWQMLAMAQQFGLPTRLLDWSYSPLVAAHFATEDQELYDQDGIIWCADIDRMNTYLPAALQDMLGKERGNIFTMEMMDRLGGDFDALTALEEEGKPFSLFFEPASAVNRIANQYALFSVCSRAETKISDVDREEKNGCFKRIIIPREVKLEIRDKLDYINISERMIYPGLSGICKWITRRYANLGPRYNAASVQGEDKNSLE